MRKIMFSERYGLEQAVIAGTKTHTRRIMMPPKKFKGEKSLMLEYRRRINVFTLTCALIKRLKIITSSTIKT